MDSIAKNSKTADQMVKQFAKHIIDSTAEASDKQEKALDVGRTRIELQMDIMSSTLLETQNGLTAMSSALNVSCMGFLVLLFIAD